VGQVLKGNALYVHRNGRERKRKEAKTKKEKKRRKGEKGETDAQDMASQPPTLSLGHHVLGVYFVVPSCSVDGADTRQFGKKTPLAQVGCYTL